MALPQGAGMGTKFKGLMPTVVKLDQGSNRWF
jgi:hypothetical protein